MEKNSKEELVALIKYLIGHNEHHNEELKDLASSLKGFHDESYQKVEEAISSFEKGNQKLSEALESLVK